MKGLLVLFTLTIFLSCKNGQKHYSGYSTSVQESKRVGAFITFIDAEIVSVDTSCRDLIKKEAWLEHSWKPTYILGFNAGYEIKSFGFVHLNTNEDLNLPTIKFKLKDNSEWKNAILDLSSNSDHLLTIPEATKLGVLTADIDGCMVEFIVPAQ